MSCRVCHRVLQRRHSERAEKHLWFGSSGGLTARVVASQVEPAAAARLAPPFPDTHVGSRNASGSQKIRHRRRFVGDHSIALDSERRSINP